MFYFFEFVADRQPQYSSCMSNDAESMPPVKRQAPSNVSPFKTKTFRQFLCKNTLTLRLTNTSVGQAAIKNKRKRRFQSEMKEMLGRKKLLKHFLMSHLLPPLDLEIIHYKKILRQLQSLLRHYLINLLALCAFISKFANRNFLNKFLFCLYCEHIYLHLHYHNEGLLINLRMEVPTFSCQVRRSKENKDLNFIYA